MKCLYVYFSLGIIIYCGYFVLVIMELIVNNYLREVKRKIKKLN